MDPNEPPEVFEDAPQIQFALTPGIANGEVINMNSNTGSKLFKGAIQKLPVEIDCTPTNLKLFLSSLEDRTMQYGWEDILSIPDDVDNILGPQKQLLSEYGQIELEHFTPPCPDLPQPP
jgi:hypothetical protein